ncbi:MAG TPA: thioredoxin family protein [Pseudonocardiaceae bacterium]
MTAVVVVLSVLTLLNSVAVIGLVRQVGVLHLRVRPMPAHGVQYGPAIGSRLAVPPPAGNSLVLFCFVSSRCGTCAAMLPSLRAVASTLIAGEALTLVLDEGDEFPAGDLPAITVANALRGSRVPGTPFLVVTDGGGVVLTAGGIGSLEQVEFLLDQGREVRAARPTLLPLTDVS